MVRKVIVGGLLMAAVATPVPANAGPAMKALFVEGDSLTVGSSGAIKSHLASEFASITVDAEVGRSTPSGIKRLRAGRAANVWVVALGTNDAPDKVTMRRNVKKVLRRAGDRPVLWVSIWRSKAYRKVNRMLSRLDTRYAQLSVLRWDLFIKNHPELLAADRIHLTPTGYEVRGRMIADAVRGLLSTR